MSAILGEKMVVTTSQSLGYLCIGPVVGVMAVQEQDADVTGFYVRLSGDLEPEPPEQTSSGSTRNAAVPAARTALAPAKPPRLRTVKPVPTAFPSNWSSRRGRPDYALRSASLLRKRDVDC